jgi:hypothetical protein
MESDHEKGIIDSLSISTNQMSLSSDSRPAAATILKNENNSVPKQEAEYSGSIDLRKGNNLFASLTAELLKDDDSLDEDYLSTNRTETYQSGSNVQKRDNNALNSSSMKAPEEVDAFNESYLDDLFGDIDQLIYD